MTDHSPAQMRAFAIDLFSAFGAQIEPRLGDELTVHLTPELAAHFGKPSLNLTFHAVELSPFEDLVVYGSRVFDQMIAWLNGAGVHTGRGVYATLGLPTRVAEPADQTALPPGVKTYNVSVVCRSHPRPMHCAVINLRITYTADDRREEVLTLVLDEHGEAHPELVEACRDAVEQAAPPTWSGKTIDRLAERAVELAQAHARQRSAEIEAEQRERVERIQEQLRRFYQGQIAEIDEEEEDEVRREEAAALKAFLNEELARKLAEEVERHRVRVEIAPVNWATLTVPAWYYELTLSRAGGLTYTLNVEHNLYNDRLTLPLCHACGQPVTDIGLCDHGHLVGAECLHTCAVCGRDLCTACGITSDPIGGEWVCADCAVRCDACGQAFIPAHTAPCTFCGRVHCQRDLRVCPVCGQEFCTAHMLRCTVCDARRCLNDARRCEAGKHVVCEQHHAICPLCGQGMCPEHTVTCSLCHQPVCSDCVGPSKICRTCGKALGSEPVTWPDLPPDMQGWTWRVAQNEHWRVYYGQKGSGLLTQWRVIVAALDGQVLYHHQHGRIDTLLDQLHGWWAKLTSPMKTKDK